MAEPKVQNQGIDQKRIDDTRQAAKTSFERELTRIRAAVKEDQALIEQPKGKQLSIIAKVLETPGDKINIEMLSKLIASVGASNIELNAQNMAAKVALQAGEDLDLLFSTAFDTKDSTLTSDQVVSNSASKGEVQQQVKKETERPDREASTTHETVSAVKEYTATYASLIMNASPDIKKKLEKVEDELKQKGLKDRDIGEIKEGVKRSVRDDLSKAIKEAFFKQLFSKEKSLDSIAAMKGLGNAVVASDKSEGAVGASFDGLRGLQKDLADEAKAEAKDLLLERLETKLLEKILSDQTKGLETELRSLVVLAVKLGVDWEQFMARWKEKKLDMGLYQMDPNLAAQLGLGDKNEKKETRYEIEEEEEKEILINRLRALYMRRAIKGDIITQIDTAFKMRTLKNGLIKLGLRVDDFDHIAKEGVEVARRKLLDMLTEALSERATLYDLAGPAFKLIEKRIKGLMSNLERIGEALTVSEFENLRDSANRKMFDIAMQELAAADAMLKTRSDGSLEKKRGQLLKLIVRLKEESKIEGVNVSFSDKDFSARDLIRESV